MTDGEWQSEAEAHLETALQVRRELQSSKKNSIDSLFGEFRDLWQLLVIELNDGGQGAGPELARSLGINVSFLNKFIKQKKPIPIRDARMVADRLVTFLRSEVSSARATSSTVGRTRRKEDPKPEKPFVVAATEWKLVVATDELQTKINEVVRVLSEVVQHAATSNLPPGDRVLTEIERAQLIAVLRTTLKMLESPMVEKGLLKKTGAMLKRAAAKAVEKQVESAFAFAAGYAAGQLTSLIPHL